MTQPDSVPGIYRARVSVSSQPGAGKPRPAPLPLPVTDRTRPRPAGRTPVTAGRTVTVVLGRGDPTVPVTDSRTVGPGIRSPGHRQVRSGPGGTRYYGTFNRRGPRPAGAAPPPGRRPGAGKLDDRAYGVVLTRMIVSELPSPGGTSELRTNLRKTFACQVALRDSGDH
eukprot:765698-Hanusia_phi.AAC.2